MTDFIFSSNWTGRDRRYEHLLTQAILAVGHPPSLYLRAFIKCGLQGMAIFILQSSCAAAVALALAAVFAAVLASLEIVVLFVILLVDRGRWW